MSKNIYDEMQSKKKIIEIDTLSNKSIEKNIVEIKEILNPEAMTFESLLYLISVFEKSNKIQTLLMDDKLIDFWKDALSKIYKKEILPYNQLMIPQDEMHPFILLAGYARTCAVKNASFSEGGKEVFKILDKIMETYHSFHAISGYITFRLDEWSALKKEGLEFSQDNINTILIRIDLLKKWHGCAGYICAANTFLEMFYRNLCKKENNKEIFNLEYNSKEGTAALIFYSQVFECLYKAAKLNSTHPKNSRISIQNNYGGDLTLSNQWEAATITEMIREIEEHNSLHKILAEEEIKNIRNKILFSDIKTENKEENNFEFEF